MAAYDIQKHFRSLRVDTGRSKGRNPFATGFEDEVDERQRSRSKNQAAPAPAPPKEEQPTISPVTAPAAAAVPAAAKTAPSNSTRDSDDEFLDPPQKKRPDRRLSPAPPQIAASQVSDGTAQRSSIDKTTASGRSARSARAQAGGILAYLDDSDDEEALAPPTTRRDRRPSPAPRHDSPAAPGRRSSTPRGEKESSQVRSAPSRHTVASPFAGTKYLQDSDDEEAVTSRQGSTDGSNQPDEDNDADIDALAPLFNTNRRHLEVKRVDKPKPQHGGGVSWRAFSASRTEQRSAEIEALQASLRRRGNSISFVSHATTDDGDRIPIGAPTSPNGPGPRGGAVRGRGRSPPRRASDVEPTADEVADSAGVERYDPTEFKTNPFTGRLKSLRHVLHKHSYSKLLTFRPQGNQSDDTTATRMSRHQTPLSSSSPEARTAASQTSKLNMSPPSERSEEIASPSSPALSSSGSNMTASIDSLRSKLTVSPQTIPESKAIDHSLEDMVERTASPVQSPTIEVPDTMSRNASVRSGRTTRASRIPGLDSHSRRSSRRSTSQNHSSMSPAQAFLSSWNRDNSVDVPAPEPKPDDEGQSIGLQNEYIIGRTINQGGFGMVKEVHTINSRTGERIIRAVKIVRKQSPGDDEAASEQAQQDLDHEVSVWRALKYRHILQLHAVYETDFATFCVMDLNVGGTLFDLVRTQRDVAAKTGGSNGLDAALARRFAYQLACALRYLHEDIRVCHRDVKLENCLIDTSGGNAGVLRLCDFGLADFLHSGSIDEGTAEQIDSLGSPSTPGRSHMRTASSVIGTLEYASPRGLSVNRKLFETAGDVWAFGVIVYALCTGELPFRHAMPSKTVELILHSDWDDSALRQAAAGGEEVIELVRGCLELDVDMRWTIGDALTSPWFEGCEEDDEISPSTSHNNGWRD